MNKTTKKFFALLLGAVMLLGLFAGCGSETPKQTQPDNDPVPTMAGSLILSTAASLEILYDTEGMVMSINGINDAGKILASNYNSMGKSCSAAIKELIAVSVKEGYLAHSVKNIVLKLNKGATLPTELFLDGLVADAKAAAKDAGSAAVVTAIGTDALDAEGYINAETAKALLLNELGVEAFDAFSGSPAPSNGAYLFTATAAGTTASYSIDADTGLITANATDDVQGGEEAEAPANDANIEEDYSDGIVDEIDIPIED